MVGRRLARDRALLYQATPALGPAEEWFADAPPAGDELASLIVLCCDQFAYTRLCLDSVLRHTHTPYELILVDNGSADETPQYVQRLRADAAAFPHLARVAVIRNETNRGYPAGCNQGLAHARGESLVFLNNDTVVTAGWLDGLIGWALRDWPRVGLVGPVTSYAPEPQQVPAGYAGLADLPGFAARRAAEYRGQALPVERLTGFCLLARRAVLAHIGGFDEQFGLGFFDDDDLCVRARAAGFELLVALDVFVHHFGSRTFLGLGVDGEGQLRENHEKFRAKWGDEQAARYPPRGRRPSCGPGGCWPGGTTRPPSPRSRRPARGPRTPSGPASSAAMCSFKRAGTPTPPSGPCGTCWPWTPGTPRRSIICMSWRSGGAARPRAPGSAPRGPFAPERKEPE